LIADGNVASPRTVEERQDPPDQIRIVARQLDGCTIIVAILSVADRARKVRT
jgi:hypothetical protein